MVQLWFSLSKEWLTKLNAWQQTPNLGWSSESVDCSGCSQYSWHSEDHRTSWKFVGLLWMHVWLVDQMNKVHSNSNRRNREKRRKERPREITWGESVSFACFDGLMMKVAQPVSVAEELIEQMPGGFDAMNDFVRETICRALEASNQHYEQTFRGLDLIGTALGVACAPIDRCESVTS